MAVKLLSKLAVPVLLAGVGVALYQLLLTDEAKNSLKNSYGVVKDAYQGITDKFIDMRGIVMDEGELPNQEATRLQWEALGY